MTVSFTAAEAALVSEIVGGLSQFTADNLKAGDMNSAYTYALAHGLTYCGWTDFNGGQSAGRGLWRHTPDLTVRVFFTDSEGSSLQIEQDIRTIIDAFLQEFVPDNTLGGSVEIALLTTIATPVAVLNAENNIVAVDIVFSFAIEEKTAAAFMR